MQHKALTTCQHPVLELFSFQNPKLKISLFSTTAQQRVCFSNRKWTKVMGKLVFFVVGNLSIFFFCMYVHVVCTCMLMYVGPRVYEGGAEMSEVVWYQQTVKTNLWRGDQGTQGRLGGCRGEGRMYVFVCCVLCVLRRGDTQCPPSPQAAGFLVLMFYGCPQISICALQNVHICLSPPFSLCPVCLSEQKKDLFLIHSHEALESQASVPFCLCKSWGSRQSDPGPGNCLSHS